jgi:hypothetical protein
MDLISFYKDYNITLHDSLLKHTTEDLDSFEMDELKDFLKYGYASKDPNYVRLATLCNSIFTHHAQTFMLTQRSFHKLIKTDTNNKYISITSEEYKLIINLMMNTDHFECLRKPKGRRSGVYKVLREDIVTLLHRLHSREWFDIQESKVCKYYDGGDEVLPEGKTAAQQMRESLKNKGFDL